MHYYGEDFDWEGLDKAINFIHNRFRRWRIPVRQSKEKFGTCRIYCSLGWYCLLNITHPGYVSYYKYPKWLVHLDIYYLPKIVKLLNFIVLPIHKYIYRDTYYKAVKMFPHLENEICCMADYVELLDFYTSKRKNI